LLWLLETIPLHPWTSGAHEKIAVLTADSQLLKPMATLIHDECSVDINDQRFVFAAWPHKMGQFHCENDDEQ
jgi:hypothetical protein